MSERSSNSPVSLTLEPPSLDVRKPQYIHTETKHNAKYNTVLHEDLLPDDAMIDSQTGGHGPQRERGEEAVEVGHGGSAGGGATSSATTMLDSLIDRTNTTIDELEDLHKQMESDDFVDLGSAARGHLGVIADPEPRGDHIDATMNTHADMASKSKLEAESKGDGNKENVKVELSSENLPAIKEEITVDESDLISLLDNMKSDKGKHDAPADDKISTVHDAPSSLEESMRLSASLESTKVAALITENERLKNEMNSFDMEFFEQLEDLKYRYAQLQEVVGEVPSQSNASRRASARSAVSVFGSKAQGHSMSPPKHRVGIHDDRRDKALPLDKLAWTARSSLTAIGKARMSSELVGHRPVYNYPGRGQTDRSSPGRLGATLSMPVTRVESKLALQGSAKALDRTHRAVGDRLSRQKDKSADTLYDDMFSRDVINKSKKAMEAEREEASLDDLLSGLDVELKEKKHKPFLEDVSVADEFARDVSFPVRHSGQPTSINLKPASHSRSETSNREDAYTYTPEYGNFGLDRPDHRHDSPARKPLLQSYRDLGSSLNRFSMSLSGDRLETISLSGQNLNEENSIFNHKHHKNTLVSPSKRSLQHTHAPFLGSLGGAEDLALEGSRPIVGGLHGVGAGVYAPEATGSFADMCERKLAFELTRLPEPDVAVAQIIHKVQDAAGLQYAIEGSDINSILFKKTGISRGYISVTRLYDVFSNVGLGLSREEVELLAGGFASDGNGNIDCEEFCDALQALLYDMVGQNAANLGSLRMREGRSSGHFDAQEAYGEDDAIEELLLIIVEAVITKDRSRRDVRGSMSSQLNDKKQIFKTVITPFIQEDADNTGVLLFDQFLAAVSCLDDKKLKASDVYALAQRYAARGSYANTQSNNYREDADADTVDSFLNRKLQGTLRGASAIDPSFGQWLGQAGTEIGLAGNGSSDGPSVEYTPLVKRLVELISGVLKTEETWENKVKHVPWVLREFDLVDTLLVQLDQMTIPERRRCLMALQYALAAADVHSHGDADGLTVLNALTSCGFRLSRNERVKLLRVVEEMGGQMEYTELCQILIRSCADWTSEERTLVAKILKAMGVTVVERRAWLSDLRQQLLLVDAHHSMKDDYRRGHSRTSRSRRDMDDDIFELNQDSDYHGIAPSMFLKCLREAAVELSVEEEALLLDCLDMERLAEIASGNRKIATASSQDTHEKDTIENRFARATHMQHTWNVPLIYYKSFLAFCARHCGHWSEILPEVTLSLKEALSTISNPAEGLHELAELLRSFDDAQRGHISSRAFQIGCRRSRLLINFAESDIQRLCDVLVTDGGGRIRYKSFLVYMRALCNVETTSDARTAPTILKQLAENATDSQGTLLPLRNWLMKHTDTDTCMMPPGQLNALLREFSVLFRPNEIDALNTEIKYSFNDAGNQTNAYNEQDPDYSGNDLRTTMLDSRKLLRLLIAHRGPWTTFQPRLCERFNKMLTIIGAERFAQADSDGREGGRAHHAFSRTPRGVETAAARYLMSRLATFSDIAPADPADGAIAVAANKRLKEFIEEDEAANDGNKRAADASVDRSGRMIERDVFYIVLKSSGVPLNDDDALILADATDDHPSASRVLCDVLVEAINAKMKESAHIRDYADAEDAEAEAEADESDASLRKLLPASLATITESGILALKEMRDSIWASAKIYRRSADEWVSDVRALFRGFDSGANGFITSEDFMLALQLLDVSLATESIRDIPIVPDGPGLVAYPAILDIILRPPLLGDFSLRTRTDAKKKSTYADENDDSYVGDEKGKGFAVVPGAVAQLVHIIRRNLIHAVPHHGKSHTARGTATEKTDKKGNDDDAAYLHLLKAFKRFDPDHSNRVSPRDFCLAVSAIMDEDDGVLSHSDWAEIIDYFRSTEDEHSRHSHRGRLTTTVDYFHFCKTVVEGGEMPGNAYESKARHHSRSHPRDSALGKPSSFYGGRPSSHRDTSHGVHSPRSPRGASVPRTGSRSSVLSRQGSRANARSPEEHSPRSPRDMYSSRHHDRHDHGHDRYREGRLSGMQSRDYSGRDHDRYVDAERGKSKKADAQSWSARPSSMGRDSAVRATSTSRSSAARGRDALREGFSSRAHSERDVTGTKRTSGGRRVAGSRAGTVGGNTLTGRTGRAATGGSTRQPTAASSSHLSRVGGGGVGGGAAKAGRETSRQAVSLHEYEFKSSSPRSDRDAHRGSYARVSASAGESAKCVEGAHRCVKKSSATRVRQALSKSLSSHEKDIAEDVRESIIDILVGVTRKSSKHDNIYETLADRLEGEDRNGSGTISRRALLAALNSLGASSSRYFQSEGQRAVLEVLESLCPGRVQLDIEDFLAFICMDRLFTASK